MANLMSEITCGHNCWMAKEVDCKCSCGGRNHGVLLVEGSEQPQRTKKAGGHLYCLESVGNRIELNNLINAILPVYTGKPNANTGWFVCNPAKAGNPFLLNYATFDQCRKWKELSEFSNISKDEIYFEAPALLWRRADVSQEYFQ